jgi:arginyl-tRNA--protein-N-Asp/Glu arginylyltransferase
MYHFYEEKIKADTEDIEKLYSQGFKYTRKAPGILQSTRLVRVNLKQFSPNSENRRILNKYPNLKVKYLELKDFEYNWEIGKWMKDFYTKKFGENIFEIPTIKKLFAGELNFNSVLIYENEGEIVGYCICYTEDKFLHYAYPFYQLESINSNLGICMMTKAIVWGLENNLEYIYLGGHTTERDNYKLQFAGIEFWDDYCRNWNNDVNLIKHKELT